ncbi:GATA transcription factor 29 [Linum perenne]
MADMEDDDDGERSGSSNSISATTSTGMGGLAMQAIVAVQGNYYELKRCSLCNTFETPMWRRGPLGPKELCNACGIKFRKEEERKRARLASTSCSHNQ